MIEHSPLPAHPAPRRTLPFLVALAGAALLAGCAGDDGAAPDPDPAPTPIDTLDIPVLGDPLALDLATWNVEWFGAPGAGPARDTLQLVRVAEVIDDAVLDLWALQEVVDRTRWSQLLASLPDYDGVLADDPDVAGGAAAYRPDEQKPALLVRSDAGRITSARVVLAEYDHEFAGRPPLEVEVRVGGAGGETSLVVVVVHMKAGAGAGDRDRREAAAAALKRHLDTAHPDRPVLVIGDFNDDVDASISGGDSPYSAFVDDAGAWVFPTAALSDDGVSSTTGYPDMIDHQLYSDEMGAGYVDGSAGVIRLDQWIANYDSTVSDHYPVMTRYRAPD